MFAKLLPNYYQIVTKLLPSYCLGIAKLLSSYCQVTVICYCQSIGYLMLRWCQVIAKLLPGLPHDPAWKKLSAGGVGVVLVKDKDGSEPINKYTLIHRELSTPCIEDPQYLLMNLLFVADCHCSFLPIPCAFNENICNLCICTTHSATISMNIQQYLCQWG